MMNKKVLKEEIGGMLSLIERMDNKVNEFEAIENKLKNINETMSRMSERRQVTRDEIFDILEHGQVKGGVKVAITYVNGKAPIKQKVYRGNVNWKSDKMGDALSKHSDMADRNWHQQLSDFNREDTTMKKNPITNIVLMETHVMNLTTDNSYAKAYSSYREKLSNLRMRYGLGLQSDGMLGDNHNQREKIDGGGQFNQNGNLSKDFNMAGSKKITSKVFLIDANGDIEDEIPEDVFYAMMKFSNGLEKDARETLTPEQIKEYQAEKRELAKAFRAQTFNYDGILSIVAKIHDGDYFYYINDKLAPSKVSVNQTAFKEMAEESLGASCDEIQGFAV